MGAWPIRDEIVQNAVSGILERSERQEDLAQLEATYVDPGIVARLDNHNNEIVYGRRGTGKTHLLRVLQHQAGARPAHLPVYIDMRVLGSDSLWESGDRPIHERVANLLRDVLKCVHDALLEYVTRPEVELRKPPYEPLNLLAEAMTDAVLVGETVTTEKSGKVSDGKGGAIDVSVGSSVGLALKSHTERINEAASTVRREGRPVGRVLFQALESSLEAAIEAAELDRAIILIDEWTAVPTELQPLLAEFVKRVCFPNPHVTVKIAALEYRSVFARPAGLNNVVGFELGSDASATLELDDYFVFDRDSVTTIKLFKELLLKHVDAECESHWVASKIETTHRKAPSIAHIRQILEQHQWESQYLAETHGIKDSSAFVRSLFEKREGFDELVRAGEGVPRDFMNIFKIAFFDAVRRSKNRIDRAAVRKAARDWFQQDKDRNIDANQRAVLEQIVNFVVGKKNARSFLFEGEAEKSEMIQTLFDHRVIHLVQRGYIADPEKPGRKYNVYTLDFGTYVELLGTTSAPQGDFTAGLSDADGVVVPFHDERAIRRIILPAHLLQSPYSP